MKKVIKSLFSILLTLIMLVSLVPSVAIRANALSQQDSIVQVARAEAQLAISGCPNKYTNWFGSLPGYPSNGYEYPWCAAFVSWCASQAGLTSLIPRFSACDAGKSWFVNCGRWQLSKAYGGSYTPQSGDVVFFSDGRTQSDSTHVGIVTGVDGNYINTVEGNYDNRVVALVRNGARLQTDSYVLGYGTPNYSSSQSPAPSLSNPSNNVTIQAGTSTNFSWSDTGASRYKIRFINASGPGTTDINVNGTNVNFTPNNAGNWTWKVCSFPDTGIEGAYSSERYFSVPGSSQPPTNGPQLNSPSDYASVDVGSLINFSWSSTGATRYKVRLYNDSGQGTTDINVTGTNFNYRLDYTGSWRWKVCAFPDTGIEETYSAERHITVNPSNPSQSGEFRVDYYKHDCYFTSSFYAWSETVNGINKNWGNGSPGNGVPNDCFGAVFTGQIYFTGGWYKFHYNVDDKIKIWLDNDCRVDQWGAHVLNQDSDAVYISQGTHQIKVEYAELQGEAKINVYWFASVEPPPVIIDDFGNDISSAACIGSDIVSSSTSGEIESGSDVDCFWFTPRYSGYYSIETYSYSGLDTIGYLLNSDGSQKNYNDDYDGCTSFYMSSQLVAGYIYYVLVSSYGSQTGDYTVWMNKLSPATPTLEPSTIAITNISVKVNITYPIDATTCEYMVGEGAWTAYTDGVSLSANDTVYAKCSDALGNISNIGSIDVSNILKLVTREDATTIIDRNQGFLYGVQPGESQLTFESLVNVSGNGRLIYDPLCGSFGTGTNISLIYNDTDAVIEAYTLVIFGDVNGDNNIDSLDAGSIVDYENYLLNFDPFVGSSQLRAADVNGDGSVDSIDAGLIVDSENYMTKIDQITGLAAFY